MRFDNEMERADREREIYDKRMRDEQAKQDASVFLSTIPANRALATQAGLSESDYWVQQLEQMRNSPLYQQMQPATRALVDQGVDTMIRQAIDRAGQAGDFAARDKLAQATGYALNNNPLDAAKASGDPRRIAEALGAGDRIAFSADGSAFALDGGPAAPSNILLGANRQTQLGGIAQAIADYQRSQVPVDSQTRMLNTLTLALKDPAAANAYAAQVYPEGVPEALQKYLASQATHVEGDTNKGARDAFQGAITQPVAPSFDTLNAGVTTTAPVPQTLAQQAQTLVSRAGSPEAALQQLQVEQTRYADALAKAQVAATPILGAMPGAGAPTLPVEMRAAQAALPQITSKLNEIKQQQAWIATLVDARRKAEEQQRVNAAMQQYLPVGR